MKIMKSEVENSKPVLYVFLNKSLHMSAGKASAQAAHAAVMAAIAMKKPTMWTNAVHRYVIVLQASDEAKIRNIADYLGERGIKTYPIIDEGATEVDAHTITALASSILEKDDPTVVQALSDFDLYRDDIKVTLEIPR